MTKCSDALQENENQMRHTGLPLPNDGLADDEPHKGMREGDVRVSG